MTRTGPLRYIANSVGPPLPENIRDQVRNDLTGSAATPGHLIRSMIAFLPVYAGVALLLSPLVLRAAALVLAVLLALVDSLIAINPGAARLSVTVPRIWRVHARPVCTNTSAQ